METQSRKLNQWQLDVLEELFSGHLTEEDILVKHKVSREIFEKWLTEVPFRTVLQNRIDSSYLKSSVLISRYAPLAAARLISLTESDKPETARRACLDIIEMGQAKGKEKDTKTLFVPEKETSAMTDEKASKILAILAEK